MLDPVLDQAANSGGQLGLEGDALVFLALDLNADDCYQSEIDCRTDALASQIQTWPVHFSPAWKGSQRR